MKRYHSNFCAIEFFNVTQFSFLLCIFYQRLSRPTCEKGGQFLALHFCPLVDSGSLLHKKLITVKINEGFDRYKKYANKMSECAYLHNSPSCTLMVCPRRSGPLCAYFSATWRTMARDSADSQRALLHFWLPLYCSFPLHSQCHNLALQSIATSPKAPHPSSMKPEVGKEMRREVSEG